ncbi:MAG: hypothetical protein ACYCY7_09895 [Gallionella sp.]
MKKPMRLTFSRLNEIHRMRDRLERDGFPRLQMSLLVTITGAAGFVASFLLLHAGMRAMSLRYLLVCAISYVVFLLLLWLWLRTRAEDYVDVPNISDGLPSHNGCGDLSPPFNGNGGDFGGAGANGSFDGAADSLSGTPDLGVTDSGGVVGDALSAAAQAEELAIPLVVLILLVTLILSSLYVIYSAPMLFAELLVDGVLAAGLYRKLRGIENRHWLETAVRRTFWPFLITALVAGAAGWAMEVYAPTAHSIGDVLYHVKPL